MTEYACVSRNNSYNVRVDDSSPRSRLSNCSGQSVLGGFTSTPMTVYRPSSGRSRIPRLPETPVSTTTGLAIIGVSPPVAVLAAHSPLALEAFPDAVAWVGVHSGSRHLAQNTPRPSPP